MGMGWIAPRRPANEGERARAALACGLLHADAAAMCDELALHARLAVGTSMSALTVVAGEEQRMVGASGTPKRVGPRETSFCAHAILATDAILCVPDAALDPRFAGNPQVRGAPWLRFYAGAPLVTRDGLAVGALCVADPQPRRELAPREAAMLRDLADEAVRLIERSPVTAA